MKELKARLKIVHELLTHAELIRSKADATEAAEANSWEIQLRARAEALEAEIAKLKPVKAKDGQPETQPELMHAE